jgi:hypothetical protein
LLTCISPPLLFADRIEGGVLEAPHLGLQKPEVHRGRAAVVVALGLGHPWSFDAEDRDAPAVRPADLDAGELAAADEAEGPEE